ncbi:hypothetical protein GGF46_000649 [Coemansia sp. RSA 552]|nr:hypothetical protein GGF46_000649 [Coemansia sp. RSA 552]
MYFTDEVAGIPLPQPCLLPRLAALTFHIDVHKKARGRRGQAGAWNVDALLRFVDALLGSGPRLTLRRLSVDSIGGGAVLGLLRGSFPLLESLSLRQYSGPEKDSMQLSDALATIMDIPALKCYSNEVAVRTRYSFIDFDCLPAEAGIRILDISSWAVTLTDMQRLVARLPRLEEICLTLTNPDEHPQPKDIAYNLEMRRLWMNTIGGTDPAWTVEALDSLAAVVTRMPNLQELLLFDKAVRWLASAVAKQNSEELLSLAFTVNVGRCNCDERAVKSTTSLIL